MQRRAPVVIEYPGRILPFDGDIFDIDHAHGVAEHAVVKSLNVNVSHHAGAVGSFEINAANPFAVIRDDTDIRHEPGIMRVVVHGLGAGIAGSHAHGTVDQAFSEALLHSLAGKHHEFGRGRRAIAGGARGKIDDTAFAALSYK
jgi:hypothetical protein